MPNTPSQTPSLLVQDFNLPKNIHPSWGRLAALLPWEESWDPRDEGSNACLANLLMGLSGKQLLHGDNGNGPGALVWDGWALLLIGDPLPESSCWKELLSMVGPSSEREVLLVGSETMRDPKRLEPLLQKVGALLAGGHHVMTFGEYNPMAPSLLPGLAIMASAYPMTPDEALSLWKGLPEETTGLFDLLQADQKECLSCLPFATLKVSWDKDPERLYADSTPRGGDYLYTERYRDSFLDEGNAPDQKDCETMPKDPMQLVLNDVGVSGAINRLKEIIDGKGDSFSPEDNGRWEIEALVGQVVKAALVHSQALCGGGECWPD